MNPGWFSSWLNLGYASAVSTAQTVAVLIPAAGRGSRLGKGPKAFLPLGDGSLLSQSLKAFEGLPATILVAVSEAMRAEVKAHVPETVTVIVGGGTRQETVRLLLQACSADIVLIHDAARPFLSAEVIAASLQAAKTHGAATVVKAVADTLIRASSGEVLDRNLLRAVQTPQSFKRGLILRAHEHARAQGITATDDAGLVRLLGKEVALVEGDTWLDKITTPADYERAQALVGLWAKRSNDARA